MTTVTPEQLSLFDTAPDAPAGFVYEADVVSTIEERELAQRLSILDFKPFEFRGYLGKRQVAPFGWRYNYEALKAEPAEPIPEFLLRLRDRVAGRLGLSSAALAQVLINRYEADAGIGWHRDKGAFSDVAGVSLLSDCQFRLRRRVGRTWERKTIRLAPRSLYLMRGPARTDWEHSIATHNALRYSVTFRTLKG